jgi:hypothetical protein
MSRRVPARNAPAREVVGRKFDRDAVSRDEPNQRRLEAPADVRCHHLAAIELDREHGVRQSLSHDSLHTERSRSPLSAG